MIKIIMFVAPIISVFLLTFLSALENTSIGKRNLKNIFKELKSNKKQYLIVGGITLIMIYCVNFCVLYFNN